VYADFLHEAPPTDACAAFIKESRMSLRDLIMFHDVPRTIVLG
jgi:hypothetical protein